MLGGLIQEIRKYYLYVLDVTVPRAFSCKLLGGLAGFVAFGKILLCPFTPVPSSVSQNKLHLTRDPASSRKAILLTEGEYSS